AHGLGIFIANSKIGVIDSLEKADLLIICDPVPVLVKNAHPVLTHGSRGYYAHALIFHNPSPSMPCASIATGNLKYRK
ncbi:MAG: hypothetical protein DRN37_05275, partial [Thermoplasmata archaeon]